LSNNGQLKPLVVINIAGLTPSLIGANTPNLNALIGDGFIKDVDTLFPALTMSVQSTILTGTLPAEHGIVGNGWYNRDLCETRFWHQSDFLVQKKKIWNHGRDRYEGFTCAKIFWQSNMYSDVDFSVTLRPVYPADGRKIPALYSFPKDLHKQLEAELGLFPYFNYWGPASGIKSSEWISACAKSVFDKYRPTLNLVYLPHLDYNLQRLGPNAPKIMEDVKKIDQVAGDLIRHVRHGGADVMIISEYGIGDVDKCIHLNRILRRESLLNVREELGLEMLDAGASRAFAVADHQIAHIYVRKSEDISQVQQLLRKVEGVEDVLSGQQIKDAGVGHERSGDLIAVAKKGCWFSYYYWFDDRLAPDFARTVDIHRKPGYDPAELFIDPTITFPKVRMVRRLIQKKLGFRTLMDLIPLDACVVKGSHGRIPDSREEGPLIISTRKDLRRDHYTMKDLSAVMLDHWRQ